MALKLEYIEIDEPLLLVWGKANDDYALFRQFALSLSEQQGSHKSLHSQNFIESIMNVQVYARNTLEDKGIVKRKNRPAFSWLLDTESWLWVADLIEPFSINDNSPGNRFQYINIAGQMDFVLSTSRGW